MKLKGLLILCAALAGILLAGCGGNQATERTPAVSSSPVPTSAAQVETVTPVPTGPRIYVARADGTGQEMISAGGGPRWSPDGRRIAFVSGSGNLGFSGAIYVVDPDGGAKAAIGDVSYSDALDPCRAVSFSSSYSWSPDGSQLAYDTDTGLHVQKGSYVVPADGSSSPTYVGRAFNPTWAPDGQSLAFTGLPASSDGCTITVADLAGGGPHPLTLGWLPTWSPDGSRIAFLKKDGVYLIDTAGSGERRLLETDRPFPRPHESIAWSPDGRWLAYSRDRTYLVDVTGEFPTADLGWGATPMWFSDSRRLAVVSYEDGQAVIYILNVDGSRQQLVSVTASQVSLSPDGSQIAFTR